MEEQILMLINNMEKATIEDIQINFNTISHKNIKRILEELESKGQIYLNSNENMYYKIGNTYKIVNILSTSKGKKYFIDEHNKKWDILDENLNGALNFSKVIVENNGQEYKVVKVLKHKYDKIVCEVIDNFDDKMLIPLNLPNNYLIHVNKKVLKRLADGDRILLKTGTTFEDNYLDCEFVKLICHKNAPDKELLSIAYDKDFDPEFSEEMLKELEYIPDNVLDTELEGRLDLRNEMVFTIDGVNTKDMDDAISLKEIDNGNYLLGVHIADVSHYVYPGMNLFEEASKRATSLYMINSVIPMLPQKLSNGICSLNPGVDRLTKSCIMEIDKNGKVISSKIVNSIINSKKKMDYDSVNHILEKGIIPKGYQEYYDVLIKMNKLAKILKKQRDGAGKIDFVSNEIEVSVDENGKPLDFTLFKQGEAERLIENFMIVANETVASYFSQLPFVYRVHGIPNEVKLESTLKEINDLGYHVNIRGNIGSPKLIQNILNSLSDKEEYNLLSNLLLCAMKKAEYSTDNIGHFGLALDYYTHFTSPIRRFPDLMVHTLINIYNNDISKLNLKELEKDLAVKCSHSSYKERQADAAERESEKLMMAEFMQEHLGEEFEATVVNNNGRNIKVKTDNLIYGVLDDNIFIDNHMDNLKIGTKIIVRVNNVSMLDKTIYFSFVSKIDKNKTKILSIEKS